MNMYQIQHDIQNEAQDLLKAILDYEAVHKHEHDFLDTIYEHYHDKIDELFEHIEKHRDNGISTFHVIGIMKSFWALENVESLNQEFLSFIDVLGPDSLCKMTQDISNDEYRFYEEQTGTEFYKLHLEESADAPHREYPFDVLSGRSVKR